VVTVKNCLKNGFVSFLLLGCVLVSLNSTNAQSGKQLGPNSFVAGIPSAEFDYFAAPEVNGKQRQANWCWAATIQMVLNYHGLYVSQEQVVERIFGALVDRPAQSSEILMALSGWAPDVHGGFSAIYATNYNFYPSQIVRDLAFKWPIIVGLRGNPIGHTYVLTAVYYRYSSSNDNEPILSKVVLRDPLPTNRSRQEMRWADFMDRLMFAARVRVKRL